MTVIGFLKIFIESYDPPPRCCRRGCWQSRRSLGLYRDPGAGAQVCAPQVAAIAVAGIHQRSGSARKGAMMGKTKIWFALTLLLAILTGFLVYR